MKHLLRAILVILLVGTILYNKVIADASNSIVNRIGRVFSFPILIVKNFLRINDFAADLVAERLENQSLRAEIFLSKIGAELSTGHLRHAKIHASYPFNNKNSFTIASGSLDGMAVGDAVLSAPGIYVGQIARVERAWSEVITAFDSAKNTPVRIGERGISGLLRGGTGLVVSMIDKTKNPAIGDKVYLASRDLPYGLVVGEIRSIRDGEGGVFKEADVAPPYALGDLSEVLVYVE